MIKECLPKVGIKLLKISYVRISSAPFLSSHQTNHTTELPVRKSKIKLMVITCDKNHFLLIANQLYGKISLALHQTQLSGDRGHSVYHIVLLPQMARMAEHSREKESTQCIQDRV